VGASRLVGLGTELAVAPLDDGALLVGRPALRLAAGRS